jgi:hypothetical protein
MRTVSIVKGLFVVLCVVLVGTTIALGSNLFDDTVSTCTGTNCSSLRIPGTVFAFGPSAGQFVLSVFASPGQCVRLDLISPPTPAPDMEMVVIAPNGTVFRNDDRNGAFDRRPLVKIASAPSNGWYTVQVGQFAGTATETNIVLLYGRYPFGNPNCATPTVPLINGNFDVQDAGKDDTPAAAPAEQPGPNR